MKKVEDIVGKALGIAPSKIKDTTSPKNTPEWDSFNGLVLATELEKHFKVTFAIEEIVVIKNVKDIKKALKKHGVSI